MEDDRSARKAISAILKHRGFQVAEAATICEATHCLHQQPNWILLDLMLPDGCGLDILRQVRAEHLKSKTIIITGCCADLLQEAQQAGAEHCFTKPLDVQRLIDVIRA